MALVITPMEMPKTTRAVDSKYPFSQLEVGGHPLIETEVVDAKKTHSKMSSALVAYRKRTGDKRKFSVRSFLANGTDAVGIWCVSAAPDEAAAA